MTDFDRLVAEYSTYLPIFIFLARVTDVSMGTVRTIFIVRGMRLRASIIGFFEVAVWVLAVSSVVRKLDDPLNVVAYAGGFAVGNWVGMWCESKLAIGKQIVRIISRDSGHEIANIIRQYGFIVTELVGRWRNGTVTICFLAAPRKEVDFIIETATAVDTEALISVEDIRATNEKHGTTSVKQRTKWKAILKKK